MTITRLRMGWRTKSAQFRTEDAFCDWVASALAKWGYRYEREVFCALTESRLDFRVQYANVELEAKVDVSWTCFDRAIGQIIRYQKFEGMAPWILVPDDVCLEGRRDLATSIGSRLVTLAELEGELHGARVRHFDSIAQLSSEELGIRLARDFMGRRKEELKRRAA